jgi:hypothetical protein
MDDPREDDVIHPNAATMKFLVFDFLFAVHQSEIGSIANATHGMRMHLEGVYYERRL